LYLIGYCEHEDLKIRNALAETTSVHLPWDAGHGYSQTPPQGGKRKRHLLRHITESSGLI